MLNQSKKTLTLIILLITCTASFAQNRNTIDSLENILKTAGKNETPEILNKLAKTYFSISLDTSMEYAGKALELSQKQGNNKQEATALKNLGIVFYYKSNYDKSLECYNQALEIFEELNDKKEIAKIYNNIGLAYRSFGNYEKAIEYYNNSLEISQEIGYKRAIAATLNNIGIVYEKWGNYEKAIEYYNNSLEMCQNIDNKRGTTNILNNIGLVYEKWGNYEKAIEHYNKSLEISREIKYKQGIAKTLNNIGFVYNNQCNYKKAIEYYNNSLEISQEVEDKQGIANTLNNIGSVYQNCGYYEKAIKFFDKSLQIAQSLNLKGIIYYSYQGLSEVYSATNEYKKSLEYYKLYTAVKDSVFNEKSRQQITKLEVRYETEKKDRQIQVLEYENNLQTIKISHQKKLHTIYLIAFILALVVITYILAQLRKKNMAYKFLVAKNLNVLSKEQELKFLKKKKTFDKSNNDRIITIKDNIKEEILEKLEEILDNEKIFRDFDLTIDKLAKSISTNRNYLSQTIYTEFGKNYNDFINEYRVKEAMLLLSDQKKCSRLSIEGIANESGFRCVSLFNLVFKKFTGITPSNFKAKL